MKQIMPFARLEELFHEEETLLKFNFVGLSITFYLLIYNQAL